MDKLLEARANDLKNLREEELLGDDLLDGMELVATQFTQDDLEGSLLPEERSLYSRMSEDERLQYLAAKNMEEARKVRIYVCFCNLSLKRNNFLCTPTLRINNVTAGGGKV